MPDTIFSLKIGGQAGQGVKAAGILLAKIATRSGYHIYTYTEFPSLIRGGHNVTQVCISQELITSQIRRTDFVVALDQKTINLHSNELSAGAALLFDEEKQYDLSSVKSDVIRFPIPLAKLAEGKELLSNTVALGALIALFGGDLQLVKTILTEEFGHKREDIVKSNHLAAEAGYNFAKEHFTKSINSLLTPQAATQFDMILNGNEAVALGAICAGLQFAAIYPMSPISNILHVLAKYQEEYGFVYKQPEDEISAINMAIGAAFAGARSMTATAGGGFCLMTEGYGLAAMTETPLVIIEGMRPGPASGLATWSEQGDLRFVLHSHQGDFPRIVLAAGDAEDTFHLTMQAFNLADKYQTPVVVMIDKNLCEDDQSVPSIDISSYKIDNGKVVTEKKEQYERYALSEDGISPRSFPGTGNYFMADSYTHTTIGYETEDAKETVDQMNKRMMKLQTCKKQDMSPPQLFGPENADVTIVSWGSTKGTILQTLKSYPNVNFLYITWMSPFPAEDVKKILQQSKHIIDIEGNYSAQLAGIIKEQTGIAIEDKLLKYDGRPFYPEEVAEKLDSVLKKV